EHLRQGRRGRRTQPAAARDRMISKPKLFKKILVANRGEIAIRVMRACREMGIATAAVYSDADRNAIHVRYADEAHHIGGAAPTESYLQLDRIVKTAHDCGAEAISHQAARSAFGDPTVYLERYIRRPRHVEIQVICDKHGNAVHLGERECSIQRRHQKIMEETPSPALTPETRAAMGAAAIRA